MATGKTATAIIKRNKEAEINMHEILKRQLEQSFGKRFIIPSEWKTFLKLVSSTYIRLDKTQELLFKNIKKETDKKTTENIEILKRYQILVNNLSIGAYRNTSGPQGRFLEANPAIVSLFEADSKEEFLKHNVSDLYLDPAERSLFAKKIMKYGFVRNEELELITLKGKKLICSVNAVMKKDKNGSVYFDGLIEDITERKKTEEALKNVRDELEIRVRERTKTLQITNSELENSRKAILNVMEDLRSEKSNTDKEKTKVEAILASIADGCVVVNENGKIILINQMAQKILGYTSKEAIGRQWNEILRREDEKGNLMSPEKGAIHAALSAACATVRGREECPVSRVKDISGIYYYVRKNKTKFPVSIVVSPVILENKIIGAIEVFRDITKEKEIDKAKTEFVSLTSHQLRTPLSAIKWYAEMLLAGDAGKLNEKQKRFINEIYNSNKRLIILVDALLNISRIELGTFTVDPKLINFSEISKSLLSELGQQITEKKMTIKEDYGSDVPKINADPNMIRIIFQNLITNAIKYTPENGTVEVSIKKKDGNVLIKISDTGYGIPKNQQSRIFEKLFRADNIKNKDTEGTGLGLYLVKAIVENEKGKIWFESEENKGTAFYVSFALSGMKKREGFKMLSEEKT